MVTTQLSGHTVEIYDNIEDLPIGRFHRYQKMLLIDSGIGGDIQAFDRHLEKARRFVMLGDKDNAGKELENLRQCVWQVQTGLSPRHRAFAVMVARIDGKDYDGGDDAVAEVLRLLNDAPVSALDETAAGVKKKIDSDLNLCFPAIFNDASVREYYDILRARTLAVLEGLAEGRVFEEIELTTKLLTYSKPQVYPGSDGVEVTFDRQFEDVCLAMGEQLHANPKAFSVFEFYNAYEFLRKRAKEAEKGRK